MTKDQLVKLIQKQVRARGSQAGWASDHGISAAYLNDILNGRRDPSDKVLQAMGLEKVVTFRKKPDGR